MASSSPCSASSPTRTGVMRSITFNITYVNANAYAEQANAATTEAIDAGQRMAVHLLYGDHEGGQRTISRFVFNSREEGQWIVVVARHWNLDRPDPR
jgi:hypothetical protein